MVFSIGGTDLRRFLAPKGFQWRRRDREGRNAGDVMSGEHIRDRLDEQGVSVPVSGGRRGAVRVQHPPGFSIGPDLGAPWEAQELRSLLPHQGQPGDVMSGEHIRDRLDVKEVLEIKLRALSTNEAALGAQQTVGRSRGVREHPARILNLVAHNIPPIAPSAGRTYLPPRHIYHRAGNKPYCTN